MRQLLNCAAVIGLSLTALASAQAGGNDGYGSHRGHEGGYGYGNHGGYGGYGYGSHGGYHSPGYGYGSNSYFNHNPHFNYGFYGTRYVNYSYRSWNNFYGCYQYWCPSSSCWYFYVPTYDYYVPTKYFSSVFQPVTTNVQTTVINEQSGPPTPPVGPGFGPAPTIPPPASTNVQTTVVDKQKGAPPFAPIIGGGPAGPTGPPAPGPVP